MEKNLSFIAGNLLLTSIFGFLIGVFIASLQSIGFFPLTITIAIVLGIFVAASSFTEKAPKWFIGIVLFFLFCAGGMLRYEIKNTNVSDQDFVKDINTQITLTAVITDEPKIKENGREYVIKTPNKDEKILVRAPFYPEFHYGDEVTFTGKLTIPKSFETDNGKEFDYGAYLKKDGIGYILSFAHGTFVSSGNGNPIKSGLYSLKNAFIDRINTSITEPESSLLAGVLLGVDSLSREIEDTFRKTGIVHIVVLSGYNITIVAESLISFFSFIPKNFALSFGAIGIIIFSLMVGGTPSVLRASLMAILVLLARATGRTYDIGRALLFAGFLMVLANPNILVFDTSFQLSFLSTIALIWISPVVEKKLTWIPENFGLRDVTSATISTQFFVLPLLLLKMGQFSLVGLPVNLLVLGFIPAIMFLGFITGLFGFISYWLAFPFAIVTQFLLSYVLKVVEIFNKLPFASVQITFFGTALFWITYLVYGFLFYKFRVQKKSTP